MNGNWEYVESYINRTQNYCEKCDRRGLQKLQHHDFFSDTLYVLCVTGQHSRELKITRKELEEIVLKEVTFKITGKTKGDNE